MTPTLPKGKAACGGRPPLILIPCKFFLRLADTVMPEGASPDGAGRQKGESIMGRT